MHLHRSIALVSIFAVLAALTVAPVLPARAEPASISASAEREAPVALAVESIGLTVSDLDRSVAFFTGVLDFERLGEDELAGPEGERLLGVFGARVRVARLRLGNEHLDLMQFLAPSTGRPMPTDTRSNDRWFQHIAVIVRDMDLAYRRLRDRGVAHASTGPQQLPEWNPAAGGISAFYFRDPDGHFLEILHFPPDKGDAKWHAPTDRLFLGIDHTAIVVDDTQASLRYYRDFLGMRVAGESENWGPEQEHLNNVFAARLRITSLRAARGPAVELLEYLTPRDGWPMPIDTRTTDLWHWHITIHATTPGGLFRPIRDWGGAPVSPGAQNTAWHSPLPRDALLARDPDGHGILFVKP